MRRARGEKESLELARGGARFGTTEAIEKCLSTFLRGADLSVTAPSTVEQVLHAPPFATGRHQDLRVQRAVQCARARRGRTSLRARWEQAAGSEAHESKNSACPARLRRGFGASLSAFLRLLQALRAPQAFSARAFNIWTPRRCEHSRTNRVPGWGLAIKGGEALTELVVSLLSLFEYQNSAKVAVYALST